MPITDLLAPPALEFRRQDIALGDAEARALALVDYPPRVGPAWLARLGDLPGVSLSVHVVPGDPLELLRAVNAGAAEYQSRLAQGGSALLRGRWERSLEDAQAVLQRATEFAGALARADLAAHVCDDHEVTDLLFSFLHPAHAGTESAHEPPPAARYVPSREVTGDADR